MSQVACILLPHYYVPTAPKVAVQADPSLLRICTNYTEVVEVSEAGQIFLDLSRLADSSTIMPTLLEEIVLTTGLHPALGWGVNRWIAKMAAHQASTRQLPASTIVPPGHEAAFLKPLPIRWAEEIPEEVCRRLEQLGIHTWGQVSSVPAHYLLAQAGLEAGNRLLRLARGEDPRPLQAWPCPPWIEVSQTGQFVSEIMPAATKLARSLAARLAAGNWAASKLALTLTGPERTTPGTNLESPEVVLSPPIPVPGDSDRLNLTSRQLVTRLLNRLQRENPELGQGNLAGEWQLTLRAEHLVRAPRQQTRLSFVTRSKDQGGEKLLIQLMDFLQGRFDPDTVRLAGEYEPDRREKVHQLLREAYELL
jgi:nucleotidyltransferase/DNA polymerase involved in DNA repair